MKMIILQFYNDGLDQEEFYFQIVKDYVMVCLIVYSIDII